MWSAGRSRATGSHSATTRRHEPRPARSPTATRRVVGRWRRPSSASASVHSNWGSASCARSTNKRTASDARIALGGLGIRERERRHDKHPFSHDSKRLSTGGQDPQTRPIGQQALNDGDTARQHVLTVIENQQQFSTRTKSPSVSDRLRSRWSRMPRVAAMVGTTMSGRSRPARSTHQTPSTRHPSSMAACRASRVFPQPPTPRSVTRRAVANEATTAASSVSRPTKLVSDSRQPRPPWLGTEAVAAAVHRLDVARLIRRIVKGTADVADRHFENGVHDKCPAPDGAEQLIFADQAARTLRQILQQRERFGLKRHPLVITPDASRVTVEPERAEPDGGYAHGGILPHAYQPLMTARTAACTTIA